MGAFFLCREKRANVAKMLLGESLTEKESNMLGDAQASAVMERLVSQHQDNVKLIQDLNAGNADETDPVKIETYKTALQQGRRNGITAVEKATRKPSEQALPIVTDNSGNQFWISGVTNVDENGRVTVTLENGAMADIETLNFTGPKIKQVFQAAGQFDTSTAEAFIDNYDGFTDPLAYETGFRHVMEDAQGGLCRTLRRAC